MINRNQWLASIFAGLLAALIVFAQAQVSPTGNVVASFACTPGEITGGPEGTDQTICSGSTTYTCNSTAFNSVRNTVNASSSHMFEALCYQSNWIDGFLG